MDPAWLLESRGPEIVTVTTILLVLSVFFVALRCIVRVFILNGLQVDDWLMLAAMTSFSLSCGFTYAGVHFGLGTHNKALPQHDEIESLKYQTLATNLYVATMAFTKLSIGFFLLRIAVQRRYSHTLKITMVVLALCSTAIFLFSIFQCTPVPAQWDYTLAGGRCAPASSFVAAAYAFSALAVITDWLFALLPIPMIWNVKMSVQAKCAVIGVLSMGIFASIATLIRVRYLIQLENLDDLLYSATDSWIWSVSECGISIMAASIVTLRPLLKVLKIKGFGSTGGSRPRRPTAQTAAHTGYERTAELADLPPRSIISKVTDVEIQVEQIGRLDGGGSDNGSEEGIICKGANSLSTRAWAPESTTAVPDDR